MTKTTAKSSLLMVQVQISAIKSQVEADSCSTANIIDEERFGLLQNALKKKLKLKPANQPRKSDSIGWKLRGRSRKY